MPCAPASAWDETDSGASPVPEIPRQDLPATARRGAPSREAPPLREPCGPLRAESGHATVSSAMRSARCVPLARTRACGPERAPPLATPAPAPRSGCPRFPAIPRFPEPDAGGRDPRPLSTTHAGYRGASRPGRAPSRLAACRPPANDPPGRPAPPTPPWRARPAASASSPARSTPSPLPSASSSSAPASSGASWRARCSGRPPAAPSPSPFWTRPRARAARPRRPGAAGRG